MTSAQLIARLNDKPDINVLVIGDAMLDKYTTCEVIGLSPECPVALKVRPKRVEYKLGGAANVALNLKTLGIDVTLAAVLGYDERAELLIEQAAAAHLICAFERDTERPTTLKHRFVTAQGQHLIRVDHESTVPFQHTRGWFGELFADVLPTDILISDYAKGMITMPLMVSAAGTNRDITVDPKQPLEFYGDVFAATPNQYEFDLKSQANIRVKNIIHTHGGNGCCLYRRAHPPGDFKSQQFPTNFKQVGDSAGCGDSFVAGFMLGKALNLDVPDSCRLGNAAGAVSFTKQGVYAVTLTDLKEELASFEYGE